MTGQMTHFKLFVLVLPFLLAPSLALHTLEPPPPAPLTRTTPEEGWVSVRLNHFDASNTDRFPMRYYYNDELSQSGDIVIMVGGEWSISPEWVSGGLPYELAEELHAGLFYTEHRYYGQSRPSNNTSSSELRFLTVDQALADLAQFIQHVKSDDFENGKYRHGKVALIGCSYAGSMATWMRLAYPHIVHAAFSDSGPLHAQEDFPEYLEVITEALRSQGGEGCVTSVEQSMERLVQLLDTQAGATQVSQLFNTCSTLQASTPLDIATFFWFGITEAFAYLVQYATPGSITTACAQLTNTAVSDPVQRLAAWITSNPLAQPCIETRYSEVVAAHTNTSFDSEKTVMRLWTYQTCVEFGWYQTTTSDQQPFLSTVPLEFFHQMCKDFFGVDFDEALLRSGIVRTNLLFGGVTFLPDYVVSVAGGADPWSPMGPNTSHAHALAPVYVVADESHCRAMGSRNMSDDSPLEQAKRAVLLHMLQFLHPVPTGAATAAACLALVVGAALAAI